MQPDTAGTAPAFRCDRTCGAPAEAHIPRQSNIYDLVEHAAVRHGVPRLQLWQEVAKALTERKLIIQNDLSERVGGLTFADWLINFRAAVDRYNDPNRGMVRILKHIIVRSADFERWRCSRGEPRRGPKSATTGYAELDRKAFPRMSRLIKAGKARSPYGAALMIANELPGHGAPETKAKRVSERYRKEHGGTYS